MELYLVLGIPLVGGGLLALWGHRTWAAELNCAMSLLTFAAAAALTARVISTGPMLTGNDQFFVDSLNVFLVALTDEFHVEATFLLRLAQGGHLRVFVQFDMSAERQPFAELAMQDEQHLRVVDDEDGNGEVDLFVDMGHGESEQWSVFSSRSGQPSFRARTEH